MLMNLKQRENKINRNKNLTATYMSENLLHFQTFDRSMRRSASQRTSIYHRLKRTDGVQICKSSFLLLLRAGRDDV